MSQDDKNVSNKVFDTSKKVGVGVAKHFAMKGAFQGISALIAKAIAAIGAVLLGWIVVIIIIVLFLYITIIGATSYFSDKIEGFMKETGASMEEIMRDPSLLLEFFDGEEFITLDNTIFIEQSDLEYLWKHVEEVNKEQTKEITVKYEYFFEEYEEVIAGIDHHEGAYYVEEWVEPFFLPTESINMSLRSVEQEPGINSIYDRFEIRWELIYALCVMAAGNNMDLWGEAWEDGVKTKGYYLSKEMVDYMIDLVSYDFSYISNPADSAWIFNKTFYNYDEFDDIAYTIEAKARVANPEIGDTSYVKRIPALAPDVFSNAYERVEYVYIDGTFSYREITTDAVSFVEKIEKYVPDFSFPVLYILLDSLPGTKELCEQIAEIDLEYQQQIEGDYEQVSIIQTQCPTTGVVLGASLYKDVVGDVSGDSNYEEGAAFSIKYKDEGVVKTYYVSEGATVDLRDSDHLSKDQLLTVLHLFEDRYVAGGSLEGYFANDIVLNALYEYQENGGSSITGYLAIMAQEGMARTKYAQYWNLFNLKAYGDQPTYALSNGTKFLDLKQLLAGDLGWFPSEDELMGAFAKALIYLFEDVDRRYLNRSKQFSAPDQYSFYTMCWNTYSYYESGDSIVITTDISHSYCPWWDDPSFPSVGWPNACGEIRMYLLSNI